MTSFGGSNTFLEVDTAAISFQVSRSTVILSLRKGLYHDLQ